MVILGVATFIIFFFVVYLRLQKQVIPITINTKFKSFAISEKAADKEGHYYQPTSVSKYLILLLIFMSLTL